MADNFYRINRGIALNPQSAPSSPSNGDIYFDSTANTYAMYQNGFWINLASIDDVASATDLTSAQFTAPIVQNSLVRVTGSTLSNVHGLLASSDGKQVIIYNAASVKILIKNESATEGTAANRIKTSGSDVTLSSGQTVALIYDAAQSRWIVASSSGGLQYTEASIANNQASPVDVAGFSVSYPDNRGFRAEVHITRIHGSTPVLPILDAAFNTNLGTGFNSSVSAFEEQTDNKIVVGGAFTSFNGNTRNYLVRLNADGTEDTAFYANLGTGFNGQVAVVKIQPDGKILVGGSFSSFNGNGIRNLVRLNADGTEDTAFSTNIGTGAAIGGAIQCIALNSTNQIHLGGDLIGFNGNTRNSFLRLNSDGTEDTAFYTNLGSAFALILGDGTTAACAVQPDDKILVGGIFTNFNGNSRNGLVRLNSDGTEDTAFYTNLGTGFTLPSAYPYIDDIEVQTDNKILVCGGFTQFNGNSRLRLIRLNANGTEDTAFYTNLGTSFTNRVSDLHLQSDGKILAVGVFTVFNGTTRNRMVRLNTDGTEDAPFYTNLGTMFSTSVDYIYVLADDTILAGGQFTTFNGASNVRFLKITQSFGGGTEYIQQGSIFGRYKPSASSWVLGGEFFDGDDAGVDLSITAVGQVQYISSNISGTLVESLIRFIILKT